ncbi:hypothetical protein PENSPDRAFT_162932 [Peniophora sp. CONT]|nr:hypothetical protein PENSPDRAFT_162932 [Peniophora sp. CONT]
MFFSILSVAAVAALTSGVAADFIKEGDAANFHLYRNQSICLGLDSAYSGASLIATTCDVESAALYPIYGSGKTTQIGFQDWCITAAGASPSSDVTVVYCSDDAAQLWTVTDYDTIETADGKCITLGKAALGAPATLSDCSIERALLQLWNPTTATL